MRYLANRNNDLFDDIFDSMFRAPVYGGESLMKTDVHEKDGKYLLDVEIPGYKKEDVKISLYNGTLTISAEHNETNEEKDAKGRILRQERYSGNCSRSFYVGDAVKDSDVHASFNNGVLSLTVPKKEAKIPEKKAIMIEG